MGDDDPHPLTRYWVCAWVRTEQHTIEYAGEQEAPLSLVQVYRMEPWSGRYAVLEEDNPTRRIRVVDLYTTAVTAVAHFLDPAWVEGDWKTVEHAATAVLMQG